MRLVAAAALLSIAPACAAPARAPADADRPALGARLAPSPQVPFRRPEVHRSIARRSGSRTGPPWPRMSLEVPVVLVSGDVSGQAFENDLGPDPETEYEDLFGFGQGISIRTLLHFHYFQTHRQDYTLGPGLLFDTVRYPGESDTDDVLGGILEADDLRITRLLPAIQLRFLFARFFIAGHIAVGPAFIASVDGTFDPDDGSGIRRGEIFGSQVVSATDLGFRAGGQVLIGRWAAVSPFFAISVGGTGQLREGDLIRAIDPDVDALDLSYTSVGFGISLEFGKVRPEE